MAHAIRVLIARDIDAYLAAARAQEPAALHHLRRVDDGKSTLIGRLLYESKMIFDDQLRALESDSQRVGTRGGELDFALLVDGLAAEREQGITIDVAYRFFSTERRKFIVADTPGHEQYTRNMVTGASTADLAVILVDARKGVLTQTRRHSYLVALLGIRRVVLAVNKMDLVGYSREPLRARSSREYREFAAPHRLVRQSRRSRCRRCTATTSSRAASACLVPRARRCWSTWRASPVEDGVRGAAVPPAGAVGQPAELRVPRLRRADRQRPRARPGDRVRVAALGPRGTRRAHRHGRRRLPSAVAGQSVTLTLDDEVDVSRGDVIAAADAPPRGARPVRGDHRLDARGADAAGARLPAEGRHAHASRRPSRRSSTRSTSTRSSSCAAERLELNEIGVCELELDRAIRLRALRGRTATLGGFILIDRLTNNTVGAGLINFALRRSQNVHWQALDVDKQLRARQKGQHACVLWLTGLSGAGKSTIANLVEKLLAARGATPTCSTATTSATGSTRTWASRAQDRVENIRRVAEVARLMVDAGLIVLVSFISPFRSERRMARELFAAGEFFEVFVDTPLAEAERRDVKGLYRKARRGELKNFTGIDSPYEAPEAAGDPHRHHGDEPGAGGRAASSRHLEARQMTGPP